ncbi:MAG: formate dehydrogenase accessory sulfurtransferase FdhD [Candidatus Thorarchaeota archaeon]|nr:formate dehydrogenase accessory sulfurtransferase FdhD [Candidatus Thorarchaeota archaeon]
MKQKRKTSFQRFVNGEITEAEETIVVESSMELWLEDMHLASFVCSPGYEKELSLGYLLTSGIIETPSDISFIEIELDRCVITSERKSDFVTSFLLSKTNPEFIPKAVSYDINNIKPVNLDYLRESVKNLQGGQHIHDETGATHAALIQEIGTETAVIIEDIGRHNAVDKVVGHIASLGTDLNRCMLLVTGRLTSELVGKAIGCNIPFMGSFTFATDMGIQLAANADITLLGSLKRNEFWIYNQGKRAPFQL